GPQAGIVVGKKELVEKLKRHPMARAVRVDKTRIAGLAATLLHYARGEAEAKIPVWKMISLPLSTLEDRASRWAATIPGAAVQPGESLVGGGSLPGSSIPTCLVCVKETAKGNSRKRLPIAVQRLRSGDPSIICRIEKDALLIDPRTVHEQEEGRLLSALRAALADAD
ncbi:MAG: L-seryl-tRNA(Sec) selenium transferase, partial [Chloroflexi bacterium]|nr:L-seryl-tRNA(Sec) selenium transferase [Chloroflexota bacterium]